MAATTAIAVAPRKVLSTGVAMSSSQRRIVGYQATATTSHLTATTLTGGPEEVVERRATRGRDARSAGVVVACLRSSCQRRPRSTAATRAGGSRPERYARHELKKAVAPERGE